MTVCTRERSVSLHTSGVATVVAMVAGMKRALHAHELTTSVNFSPDWGA
jgi:hypothetical protein